MSHRGRPHGTRWLLAGYAGLAGFFALEAAVRQPGGASSLRASGDDRGTTRLIAAAYGVGAELPLLLRRLPTPELPAAVGACGLVMQACGLALRAWSMRALGGLYSRTLRTEGRGHALVDTGPYRLVRHPGYAGSLLTWAGFALTSRDPAAAALVVGLVGAAYARRIAAEERLLGRDLPGYTAYSDGRKRIVPFVW